MPEGAVVVVVVVEPEQAWPVVGLKPVVPVQPGTLEVVVVVVVVVVEVEDEVDDIEFKTPRVNGPT